jgi:hypothetical protein
MVEMPVGQDKGIDIKQIYVRHSVSIADERVRVPNVKQHVPVPILEEIGHARFP